MSSPSVSEIQDWLSEVREEGIRGDLLVMHCPQGYGNGEVEIWHRLASARQFAPLDETAAIVEAATAHSQKFLSLQQYTARLGPRVQPFIINVCDGYIGGLSKMVMNGHRVWLDVTVDHAPGLGGVYFLRAGQQEHVKIGESGCVRKRMLTLQAANPEKLTLIYFEIIDDKTIRCTRERQFHSVFAHLRMSNEWFRLEGDLAEFVKRNR